MWRTHRGERGLRFACRRGEELVQALDVFRACVLRSGGRGRYRSLRTVTPLRRGWKENT